MKTKLINWYIKFLRVMSILICIVYVLRTRDCFIIFSMVFFIFLSTGFYYIDKKYKLNSNALTMFLYNTFMMMSVFLGGGLHLYEKFFWWDILVHFISGILFFDLGILISNKMHISSKYKLFFAFLMVAASTSIWEIIEFSMDSIINTDMQEWKRNAYEPFVRFYKERGHSLVDTMMDMIYAMLGYVFSSIFYKKN